jgi:hypothetical protein
MYRPNYSGNIRRRKYIAHKTPSGAMALPIDCKTEKRKLNGFKLYYNGWKMPEPK